MKKATKLLASFALAIAVVFTGCNDSGSPTSPGGSDGDAGSLVGIWSRTEATGKTVLTVGADGSYKEVLSMNVAVTGYSRKTGTWKVAGDTFIVALTSADASLDGSKWANAVPMTQSLKYTYQVDGDVLVVSLNGVMETRYVQGTGGNVPAEVVAAPIITPATGSYASTQSVTIKAADLGALVFYTLDGTTPTQASTLYADTIKVSATKTVKAIAVKSGTVSSVASETITIKTDDSGASTPPDSERTSPVGTWSRSDATGKTVLTVGADGSYKEVLSMELGGATGYMRKLGTWKVAGDTFIVSLASMDASVDDSNWMNATPINESLKYGYVVDGSLLKVIRKGAVDFRYVRGLGGDSTVAAVAAPTITPATGTYSSTQSVTIEAANLGALVYFTLDGTTPTRSSFLYTDAIEVSATRTVKAIAVKNGTVSPVAGATITIQAGGDGGSTTNTALIGTWTISESGYSEAMTLSAGGVFSNTSLEASPDGTNLYRIAGKWSTTGQKLTFMFTKFESSSDGITWVVQPNPGTIDATYSISGTKLTVTGSEGVPQVYTKS